jgi:hypothetical protein
MEGDAALSPSAKRKARAGASKAAEVAEGSSQPRTHRRVEALGTAKAAGGSCQQRMRGETEATGLAELVSVQQALLREAVASWRVLENYSGLLVQLLERMIDAEERRWDYMGTSFVGGVEEVVSVAENEVGTEVETMQVEETEVEDVSEEEQSCGKDLWAELEEDED